MSNKYCKNRKVLKDLKIIMIRLNNTLTNLLIANIVRRASKEYKIVKYLKFHKRKDKNVNNFI